MPGTHSADQRQKWFATLILDASSKVTVWERAKKNQKTMRIVDRCRVRDIEMVLTRRLMEGDHHRYLPTEGCSVPPCSRQGRPGTLVGTALNLARTFSPGRVFLAFGFWGLAEPSRVKELELESAEKGKTLSRHLEV